MNTKTWTIGGAIALAIILIIVTAIASTAPKSFEANTSIVISNGETLTGAANILKKNGIIRSAFLFRVYSTILDENSGIKTGEYLFSKPESVLRIASRLVHGELGFPVVKVTIPEGLDSKDIAAVIAKAIPSFPKDEFIKLARENEGYLFPETYFWPINAKPERVVQDMKSQFVAKIATLKNELTKNGKSIDEVMKVASIVEKEATSSTDRRVVAGVLWKRLKDGMALQVDPPFKYFLNKTSDKLTLDDLKVESPYNLYLHTGLPPTPISNPGLAAILDTINPTSTAYWFYLSGKDGTMHYAKTLDGHVANKYKYLD